MCDAGVTPSQAHTRLMIAVSRTQQGVTATLGSKLKSVSDGTGLVECCHDERVIRYELVA